MNLVRKLRSNTFFRNTAILTSGTTLSQIVLVIISPILSRIYTPDDFGIYGTVMTISTIIAAVGAFRLELGLVLEKNELEKIKLLKYCLYLIIFIFFGVLFISLILPFTINYFHDDLSLFVPIVFAVFIYFLTVIIKIVQQYLSSARQYKLYSLSQIVRSVSTAIFQPLFGLLNIGGYGLIIGYFFGSLVAVFQLFKKNKLYKKLREIKLTINDKKLIYQKHIDFVKYSAPQDLLNSISQHLPIFFLGYFYGVNVVGLYWFGVRIIQLPGMLIGSAIKEVFYKEAADRQNDKRFLLSFFNRTTFGLLVAIIPIIIIFFIIAPWAFGFIFGSEWIEAGEMARWLFVWVGISFCNIPAGQMFYVTNNQKYLLFFEIIVSSSRLFVLLFGGLYWPLMTTIIVFSILGFILNSLLIGSMYYYLNFKYHE